MAAPTILKRQVPFITASLMASSSFVDLPVELLPVVLDHLLKSHLLACCLVSHSFCTFATPKLYEYASIFSWRRNAKAKVRF
jgi:hypothetical protein